MNYPFFVYGTLKPGEPNYARLLAGRTAGEELASLAGGALFSAGAYPYLTMEPDLAGPDERVAGALISVPDGDYETMLAALDELEGYVAGGAANMYERLLVTVETDRGLCPAWVYLAGVAALAQIRAGALPKILGGDWRSDPAALNFWRNA